MDCTAGKLDSGDCYTGRLHVCQTHAATLSLDAHVDRAGPHAESRSLEAIDTLRK